MDLTKLTTIKITRTMKNLILAFVACLMSLVVASCGGRSNSSEADKIAQLEDSIRKIQSDKPQEEVKESTENSSAVVSETPIQKEQEENISQEEEQGWKGVSSRSDFPSALSGTTWITEDQKVKLVFNGDKVKLYYSKPRRNYDDPVEWFNAGPDWNTYDNPEYILYFHLVQEPQKGHYKLQYRKDPSGNNGLINLEIKGNKIYYATYNQNPKYRLMKQDK